MDPIPCLGCSTFFIPRNKLQTHCSAPACQRARKTLWQRQKLATDPEYEQGQKLSNNKWLASKPNYWKDYRFQNPDKAARKAPMQCGAVTHDTPSAGGLVMLGPIAIAGFLQNNSLKIVQGLCREHLFLTHPDAFLAGISDAFVHLVQSLLFRKNDEPLQQLIAETARQSVGLDLRRLASQVRSDNEVAGGRYSTACYIAGNDTCFTEPVPAPERCGWADTAAAAGG